jgi:transketolase
MAIAGKFLGERYNRRGFDLFDYRTYALCGDGCLMEGIGAEAASLAGHLALDNLCWIYDNNHITIEGDTAFTFTEDVMTRFRAYRWNVLYIENANDLNAIETALRSSADAHKPTLIVIRSHIGYGSPHKHDSAEAHGEPLGAEEVRATKRAYGWPEEAQFRVPEEVRTHFAAGIGARGARAHRVWAQLFDRYRLEYPALALEIEQMQRWELPAGWDLDLPVFAADARGIAGRDAAGATLNALASRVPWMLGGSADLAPSNRTRLKFEGAGDFQPGDRAGRNLHFGVREHAMAAVVNGMALSKLRAFGATFFIFSDYARPAIRLSALMELPALFLFTHDAMGDGEDGPTHQPVEHLAAFRAIPGLTLLRPADANEVVEAFRCAMQLRHRPTLIVLSRQALPTLDRGRYASAAGLARGAYVLADPPTGAPQVILIATGSEVHPALRAHERLLAEGIDSRVVSMPSWDLFEEQPVEYRHQVLPPAIEARIAIEQASSFGWERHVGPRGRIIAMHTFGASAPLKELQRRYGFEPESVISAVKSMLADQEVERARAAPPDGGSSAAKRE